MDSCKTKTEKHIVGKSKQQNTTEFRRKELDYSLVALKCKCFALFWSASWKLTFSKHSADSSKPAFSYRLWNHLPSLLLHLGFEFDHLV